MSGQPASLHQFASKCKELGLRIDKSGEALIEIVPLKPLYEDFVCFCTTNNRPRAVGTFEKFVQGLQKMDVNISKRKFVTEINLCKAIFKNQPLLIEEDLCGLNIAMDTKEAAEVRCYEVLEAPPPSPPAPPAAPKPEEYRTWCAVFAP